MFCMKQVVLGTIIYEPAEHFLEKKYYICGCFVMQQLTGFQKLFK